jgi:DNA-binding CsgD family transcriptional regulator
VATHVSGHRQGALPAGRTGRVARWIVYAAPGATSPDCLSPRELDVLALVATGRTDVEIARHLSISPRTVGAHVSNMLNKTSVSNRVELVIWAIASEVLGLMPQP